MLKVVSYIYIGILRFFGITIKENVQIRPLVFVSKGYAAGQKGQVIIGKDCELSQGVIFKAYGGRIKVGENTFFGEYVVVYGHGGVEIGANTLIAMHTSIVSSNHAIPGKDILIRSRPDELLPVKIGDDVWIGAGARILGGVKIGDGCIIGAGAVVSRSLPPYSIAVGIPARVTGYRND